MTDRTRPTKETREAERDEAQAEHVADQVPDDDETAAAERAEAELEPEASKVGEHYREMTELGAEAKGEGRLP